VAGNELIDADLSRSGLVAADLDARPLGVAERASAFINYDVQGYVIPYTKIDGSPLAHWRARLFESDVKYRQPKDTSNYVYFPKGFLEAAKSKPYIILTEGEKKAALATKLGFPCVGFGGVDSWRNRNIQLPDSTELSPQGSKVAAKLPSGGTLEEDFMSGLALGFQELIDYAIQNDKHLVICYDTDDGHIKPSVQRAAATLGFELRFRGIAFNRIRQLVLPGKESKIGLDDYLLNHKTEFPQLISQTLKERAAFPVYPAVSDFINKRLQKPKLSRKELQQVSIAILSDLDSNGFRLRSEQELQTYYFDNQNSKLLKAEFGRQEGFHDTRFGQFLYRRYGISSADDRVTEWLAAQFTGEEPVGSVTPHRVLARSNGRDDAVTLQLSDDKYARVDADGLRIYKNGENGILFESEQVSAVSPEAVQAEFTRQLANSQKHVQSYWLETLQSVRLKDHGDGRTVAALLYYMSPWLYRWRGTQLPVEMVTGESGSGKSSLYELRLSILTGDPRLRNAPTDLKDWHASIVNTGGLHVTDNVQFVDRNMRQRISDELCRIITEPAPAIEQRKYYTNAELVRIPVHAIFAFTAISQPFQNADLLQRSVITEFDKMGKANPSEPINIRYDSEWRNTQLQKFNGRAGWVAHHLLVLHKFFQLVRQKWNRDYQAHHRLINFEQSMILMAEVLGIDPSFIPKYLEGITDKALSDSDWTFEGLKAFAKHAHYYKNGITTTTIADWASHQEEFSKCEMLTQPRKLGRYLTLHRTMIASSIGLVEITNVNGRQSYAVMNQVKPENQNLTTN
jgi:hypothetical protein